MTKVDGNEGFYKMAFCLTATLAVKDDVETPNVSTWSYCSQLGPFVDSSSR